MRFFFFFFHKQHKSRLTYFYLFTFYFRDTGRQILSTFSPVEQKLYLSSNEKEEGLIDQRVLKQKYVHNAFTKFYLFFVNDIVFVLSIGGQVLV